jgi:hypothetical protein
MGGREECEKTGRVPVTLNNFRVRVADLGLAGTCPVGSIFQEGQGAPYERNFLPGRLRPVGEASNLNPFVFIILCH